MKPLNPLADHLKGIVTTTDLEKERPKEGPVSTKKVAGGIIKRIPIDRTARIVTAPANWMCKPLFEKIEPETISQELINYKYQLRGLNETLQELISKLKAKNKECLKLKVQNQELRNSLSIALRSCEQNIKAMGQIAKELT